MTHEEKLLTALAYLETKNDEDEAVEILAGYLHESTMSLPQKCWYGKEFCESRKLAQDTARHQLRKLPYGQEILDYELSHS